MKNIPWAYIGLYGSRLKTTPVSEGEEQGHVKNKHEIDEF